MGDGVEGKRDIPAVDILLGRKHFLAGGRLAVEKLLELEELLGDELVLEQGQPALVERVNLELEQLPLLGGERGGPFGLVELGSCGFRCSTTAVAASTPGCG